MSTQLLDTPTPHAAEITAENAAAAPPQAATPSFDRPTRVRVAVADELATTLEGLTESKAWERLDPSVAAHLLAQAERLRDHAARLQDERPVRRCEELALRLRRLERRLDVSIDLLGEHDEERARAQGMFLGDFTEPDPSERPVGDAPAKNGKDAQKAKKSIATAKHAVQSVKTRAERLAAKAMERRLWAYALAGVAVIAVSIGLNMKESLQERSVVRKPPPNGFQADAFLEDMKAFLPVEQTGQRDRTLSVVVSKEWLLRTWDQRRVDAESAHVFLRNRNVTQMLLAWPDGNPIARFADGNATWFEEGQLAPKDQATHAGGERQPPPDVDESSMGDEPPGR